MRRHFLFHCRGEADVLALSVRRQGFMPVFASHFYIMGEAGRRRSVSLYDDTRTSSFKEEDYGRRLATGFIRSSGGIRRFQ